MNKQEYENEIAKLKTRIALLELNKPDDESGTWKPQKHDFYFAVDWDGKIIKLMWLNGKKEETAYSMGNVFKNKEDAEFEVERRKVFRELKQFSCEVEQNKRLWSIAYYLGNKGVSFIQSINCRKGLLYFPSEKQAKKAIKSVGMKRVMKYYLGVKE